MDRINSIMDKMGVSTDGTLKYEICFLISFLIILIVVKYYLQNRINNIKPSLMLLIYLEKDKKHILVSNKMVPEFIKNGWKIKLSFNVFRGRFTQSNKFIVYTLSNNLLIVQEGETIPITAIKQLEFFAFSSKEDSTVDTKPITIGYFNEQDNVKTIICTTEKECLKCDKTQTIHVPM